MLDLTLSPRELAKLLMEEFFQEVWFTFVPEVQPRTCIRFGCKRIEVPIQANFKTSSARIYDKCRGGHVIFETTFSQRAVQQGDKIIFEGIDWWDGE